MSRSSEAGPDVTPATMSQVEGAFQPIAGAEALVLAAGAGRRFGGGKLLAPWRGRPLIQHAVEIALRAPVERVVVVLGCDADALRIALEPVQSPRLGIVFNAQWKAGLSTSLIVGLDHLAPATRHVVVFLGDMPLVPVDHAERLLAALIAGAPAALVRCAGKPAHPVAFSRSLFGVLRELTGDRGGRDRLESTEGVTFIDSTDAGSCFDVDRPSDLAIPASPR